MTESIKDVKSEETNTIRKDFMHISHSESNVAEKQLDSKEPEIEQSSASVQKPVDLYKVLVLSSVEKCMCMRCLFHLVSRMHVSIYLQTYIRV